MKLIKKLVKWLSDKLDPLSCSTPIITEEQIDQMEEREKERALTKDDNNKKPYDGMEP